MSDLDLKQRIAETRELDKAAKVGPWTCSSTPTHEALTTFSDGWTVYPGPDESGPVADVSEQENATLVARYRTIAPELAADLERVMAERDKAIGLAAEAIPYASTYFRNKWRLDERLAELKKAKDGDDALLQDQK